MKDHSGPEDYPQYTLFPLAVDNGEVTTPQPSPEARPRATTDPEETDPREAAYEGLGGRGSVEDLTLEQAETLYRVGLGGAAVKRIIEREATTPSSESDVPIPPLSEATSAGESDARRDALRLAEEIGLRSLRNKHGGDPRLLAALERNLRERARI